MKIGEMFAYPWVLPAALVLVPLVWWSWMNPRRRPSVRFSSLNLIPPGAPTWSAKARVVLPILRSIAVLMLVICVARPQRADEMTRIKTEGVALELVVDRSSSMNEEDFRDEQNRPRSRFQVVKDVVMKFIAGDGRDLPGRGDDLIGLTVFARYPDTICPLTWDHDHVVRAVKETRTAASRDEDGTAIGDAMLLAIERIRNIGRKFQEGQDFKLTSRAVILLTDGEQTAGKYKPEEAAEAAKALGIKVYTIGAAPLFVEERVGGFTLGRRPAPVDEESLQKVADMTGGRYFRATDEASLSAIYGEIDKLERSEVDEKRYYVYEELAFRWIELRGLKLPPPLLVALVALGLEQLLAATRFRKIP